MRRDSYEYQVHTVVRYTRTDLNILLKCAATHYDTVCKNAGKVGGFLHGMGTVLGFEEDEGSKEAEYTVTNRQLDTLCKIMENQDTVEEAALYLVLRRLIQQAGEEYRRLNEAARVG